MPECRGCGVPVLWRITPNGKRMILDANPVTEWAKGTYIVRGRQDCEPATPLDVAAGTPIYMNHFATCPKRDSFRKPK